MKFFFRSLALSILLPAMSCAGKKGEIPPAGEPTGSDLIARRGDRAGEVVSFQEDSPSFAEFLGTFQEVRLPFTIDPTSEPYRSIHKVAEIDSALRIRFIADSSDFHDMRSCFHGFWDFWRPCARFKVDDSLTAVVVVASGGSGGIYDQYFLLTYSADGRRMGTLTFAVHSGDAGHEYVMSGGVNRNMVIRTAWRYGETDDPQGGGDSYRTISSGAQRFIITASGSIDSARSSR